MEPRNSACYVTGPGLLSSTTLDDNFGFIGVVKLFPIQVLVFESTVRAFIGAVLPTFAGPDRALSMPASAS